MRDVSSLSLSASSAVTAVGVRWAAAQDPPHHQQISLLRLSLIYIYTSRVWPVM